MNDGDRMADSLLTGIYTLTPTHCGTGQASGAVDLPIARESHTGLPVLPASGLKGAARALLEENKEADKKLAEYLFGSELVAVGKEDTGAESNGKSGSSGADQEKASSQSRQAGYLVTLEGRLLFYPVRSLQRPFLYATCPMILERLKRDLRALELADQFGLNWSVPQVGVKENAPAVVVSKPLAGKVLVIEDFVYKAEEVGEFMAAEQLTKIARLLLPKDESETAERLAQSLVVMNDRDFATLVQRAIPVQARIRLDEDSKTTSGKGGNLWYEETLPSDCVFTVLLTNRAGYERARGKWKSPVDQFQQLLAGRKTIQLGGNETVGQGFCWWTPAQS
jgi:CRISPR-associated protein Cmr4